MNPFELNNLEGPNGEDNTPGLLGYVLLALERDFATIAKAPKLGAAAGDTAIITDAHTFKATKGFVKVYMTLDSNTLKAALVGERDGKGYKISFEGFHPGNKASVLEFARVVKNLGLIMLVPDADGTYLQVGSEGLPVELAPDFDSGKLSGGRRGFTIKGEAYANGLYIYAGDITMKP
ncbi:2-phosphosulfolactate phosphatase [Hymenobacter sp. 5317J-9]|uniref:2-phosphosulfolactate phosphatase n=1 Tax=Hymenobacter sp. 5317J-9 TaxID=2932250 RepID=UPI001FD63576|nr:2-phosphosulfolactate phosphatase [Hymenobacter sp. 5317J-9]UOQ99894.1 2-phosphosulfolactate phosphatase [Hymenobacter sp. 5317J-9]